MLTNNVVKQDKEGKLNLINGGNRTNGTNGVNGANRRTGTNGGNINSYSAEDVYTVEPYVMDVKQTAVFLNCSEYKVKDMCRKREIPHLRYGNKPQGKIYFTQKALIQWLEKQERRNWR